jgi:hypothetical protein
MFPSVVYGLKRRVSKWSGSIGKSSNNVLRCWLDLPSHHGGMHGIDIWYYVVNAGMHCVDVAMGIDTLMVILLKIICCIIKFYGVKNA